VLARARPLRLNQHGPAGPSVLRLGRFPCSFDL
jgi:hypothetical protein